MLLHLQWMRIRRICYEEKTKHDFSSGQLFHITRSLWTIIFTPEKHFDGDYATIIQKPFPTGRDRVIMNWLLSRKASFFFQ